MLVDSAAGAVTRPSAKLEQTAAASTVAAATPRVRELPPLRIEMAPCVASIGLSSLRDLV